MNQAITNVEEYSDYAQIAPLGGCCNYGDVGLDGFQVDFTINEKYRISYQSEERNNGLKNYAGFEMTAQNNGNDDYNEFLKLLDHDFEHTLFQQMEAQAESLAKLELERQKNLYLESRGFPLSLSDELVINSLDDLDEFLKAYVKLSDTDRQWARIHIESKKELGIKFSGHSLDFSSLPTFGGEAPECTLGVWSWDADRLLMWSGNGVLGEFVERQ